MIKPVLKVLGIVVAVLAVEAGGYMMWWQSHGDEGAGFGVRWSIPQAVSPEAHAVFAHYMPIMAAASKTFKAPLTAEEFAAARAKEQAGVAERNASLPDEYGVNFTDGKLAGVDVVETKPKDFHDDGTVLVHVHGGAWVMGSAHSTLGLDASFASITGKRIVSVDYTVAPKGQWQTQTDQVVAVYKAVRAQGYAGHSIGLIGESAGGNLVAAATLKLRDQGEEMPGAVVMLSPGLDLGMRSDTWNTLKDADPVLSDENSIRAAIKLYVPNDADLDNPYVSPVLADFSKGYPPVLLQLGTREIVLSDAVRLYQALIGAGLPAVLDIYEGMPHVFMSYMKKAPESQTAFARQKAFWAAHLAVKQKR